jgi:hypothetical protein
MHRFLGILIALSIVAGASSEAFAKDSNPPQSPQAPVAEKKVQNDLVASTELGFAPDGLARDVMNLMTGLSHPIDGSTNLTVQAGKSLRIGISF